MDGLEWDTDAHGLSATGDGAVGEDELTWLEWYTAQDRNEANHLSLLGSCEPTSNADGSPSAIEEQLARITTATRWIWRTGAYAGEFGDAFIDNTDLQGGDVSDAIRTLFSVFAPLLDVRSASNAEEPSRTSLLSVYAPLLSAKRSDEVKEARSVSVMRRVFKVLLEAAHYGDELASARGDLSKFHQFLGRVLQRVECLGPGEMLAINGGWLQPDYGHAVMYVVEKERAGGDGETDSGGQEHETPASYSFTIINTGEGCEYHDAVYNDYPKLKRKAAMSIPGISADHMLDETFWYLLFKLRYGFSKTHEAAQLYDVLVPFLWEGSQVYAGKEQGDAVLRDVRASTTLGEAMGDEGEYETMQRAGTCFFRCVLSTVRYLCKRFGCSKAERKQLTFSIRIAFVKRLHYDLERLQKLVERDPAKHVDLADSLVQHGLGGGWQENDERMVKLGTDLLGLCAVKQWNSGQVTEAMLGNVAALSATVRQASQLLTRTVAEKGIAEHTGAIVACTPFETSPSSDLIAFDGFELLRTAGTADHLGSVESMAGVELATRKTLHVNLIPRRLDVSVSRGESQYMELLASLESTVAQCNQCFEQARASLPHILMHHICSTVEDLLLSEIPTPTPPSHQPSLMPSAMKMSTSPTSSILEDLKRTAKGESSQFWLTFRVPNRARKQRMLRTLHRLALQYLAASYSLPQDRSRCSMRALAMLKMMAIFDIVLCAPIIAKECDSLLAAVLLGDSTASIAGPESSGFSLACSSLEGRSLREVFASHFATSPRDIEERSKSLHYLDWRERGGRKRPSVMDFRGSPDRALTQLKLKSNDNTLRFVQELSRRVTEAECPPVDDFSLNTPSTGSQRSESDDFFVLGELEMENPLGSSPLGTPDRADESARSSNKARADDQSQLHPLERKGKLLCDHKHWRSQAPEFTHYRDMVLLFKCSLELHPAFISNNPHLVRGSGYLNPRDMRPKWSVRGRTTDRGGVGIAIRLGGQSRLTFGYPLPLSPSWPSRFLPPETTMALPEKPHALAMMIKGVAVKQLDATHRVYKESEMVSEGEILHKQVYMFENALTLSESRRLLCLLTGPCTSLPLILSFFADGRSSALINRELQDVLWSCLFEPRYLLETDEREPVTDVPCNLRKRKVQLATPHGVLWFELQRNPAAIIRPLQAMLENAVQFCTGEYSPSFAMLLRLLIRISIAVFQVYIRVASMGGVLRSPVASNALEYLEESAIPVIESWIDLPQLRDDTHRCIDLRTHLVLIADWRLHVREETERSISRLEITEGEVPRWVRTAAKDRDALFAQLLYSFTYILSWYSKLNTENCLDRKDLFGSPEYAIMGGAKDPLKDETNPYVRSVPLSVVFNVQHRRRRHLVEWVESLTPPIQARLLTNMVQVSVYSTSQSLSRLSHRGIARANDAADKSPGGSAADDSAPIRHWERVSSVPRMCERTLESTHPYEAAQDWYEHVEFPGAPYIAVTFDSSSRTAGPRDFLTLFKDRSYTEYWGPERIYGDDRDLWRDANAPYIVNGDSVYIHFHTESAPIFMSDSSDGRNIHDHWGFRMDLKAPVCQASAHSLFLAFSPQNVSFRACQVALVKYNNNFEEARIALSTEELLSIEDEVSREMHDEEMTHGAYVPGMYQTAVGSVQVSVQTGQVSVHDRSLMPVRSAVSNCADFQTVFGSQPPPCALISQQKEREWLQIMTPQASFQVQAWTPLPLSSILRPEKMAGRFALQEVMYKRPRELEEYALPLQLDDNTVWYEQQQFVPYTPGSMGWISQLFDPLMCDAKKQSPAFLHTVESEPEPRITVWANRNVEPAERCSGFARMLVFVEEFCKNESIPEEEEVIEQDDDSGDEGEPMSLFARQHKPREAEQDRWVGRYYEVHDVLDRQLLQVFGLHVSGRTVYRSLVYTSNNRFALRYLSVNDAERDSPYFPRTEDAAGDMFEFIGEQNLRQNTFDGGEGDAITTGDDWERSVVGSVVIQRQEYGGWDHLQIKRGTSSSAKMTEASSSNTSSTSSIASLASTAPEDARRLQQFVPARMLYGLLPDALLERYVFWRTSPSTLRGELRRKRGNAQEYVLVNMKASGAATVSRVRHGSQGEEVSMLLNALSAPTTSALGALGTRLSQLDSLAYVLVWSHSRGSLGDEVPISEVEFPRLKLTLEMRFWQGKHRLYTTQHDGLFVSDKISPEIAKVGTTLVHWLVLENEFADHFIMLPNYALRQVKIRSCPFSSPLVTVRSAEDWSDHIRSRYYLLPVLSSGRITSPPSFSATLYLVVLRLFRREYHLAARRLRECHSDTELEAEHIWMLKHIELMADDAHPDAHACRLRLALVCAHAKSIQAVSWDVADDFEAYLEKYAHVSRQCRLSLREEHDIAEFNWCVEQHRYVVDALERTRASRATQTVSLSVPQPRRPGVKLRALYYGAHRELQDRGERKPVHLFYAYKPRPEKLRGVSGMRTLLTIEADQLDGSKHRTGLFLLYEMLIGTRRIQLDLRHGADEDSGVREVPFTMKTRAASAGTPVEPRKSPLVKPGAAPPPLPTRQQLDTIAIAKRRSGATTGEDVTPVPGTGESNSRIVDVRSQRMARLMIHSLFTMYYTDEQGLPPDVRVSFAMLAAVQAAVEVDSSYEGVASMFPALPHTLLDELMEKSKDAGFWTDRSQGKLDSFEKLLTRAATSVIRSDEWGRHRKHQAKIGPPHARDEDSQVLVGVKALSLRRIDLDDAQCGTAKFTLRKEDGVSSAALNTDAPGMMSGSSNSSDDCPSQRIIEDYEAYASEPLSVMETSQFVHMENVDAQSDASPPPDYASPVEMFRPTENKMTRRQIGKRTVGRMVEDLQRTRHKGPSSASLGTINRELVCAITKELSRTESQDESEGILSSSTRTGMTKAVREIRSLISRLRSLAARDQQTVVRLCENAEKLANALPIQSTTTWRETCGSRSYEDIESLFDEASVLVLAPPEQMSLRHSTTGIVRARASLTKATTKATAKQDRGAQISYWLRREAGECTWLSYDVLSTVFVSSTPIFTLQRFNPFLSPENARRVLFQVATSLFASTRLRHANQCIAQARSLVHALKQTLREHVCAALSGLGLMSIHVGAAEMAIDYVLEQTHFHADDAIAKLKDMLGIERTSLWKTLTACSHASTLSTEEQMRLVSVVYQYHGFDVRHAEQHLRQCDVVSLLDLSQRACYHHGRVLLHSSSSGQNTYSLSDSDGAQEERSRMHLQEDRKELAQTITHWSKKLASSLLHCRHFVDVERNTNSVSFKFDPRFLAFEANCGFLLRKRQIQLVEKLAADAVGRRSGVHQMIMGAGKTSVITPLLALLLADGETLVMQVIPSTLLTMSRNVLRNCFSGPLWKRIYTLEYSRASLGDVDRAQVSGMLRKLERARRQQSLVCTTPEAVKSLLLQYLDLLGAVEAAPRIAFLPERYLSTPEIRTRAKVAAEECREAEVIAGKLQKILQLLRTSSCAVLDEVDLLLHPLKSELNFPVGAREDLPTTPARWDVPMHLFAPLFYFTSGGILDTSIAPDDFVMQCVREIANNLQVGCDRMMISRSPHLVLLSQDFYHQHLKRSFARWALVWLMQQSVVRTDQHRCTRNRTMKTVEWPLPSSWEDLMVVYMSSSTVDNAVQEQMAYVASRKSLQYINLCRFWVINFLPHCLQKIHRVSYGLISPGAAAAGSKRHLVAVPFIGKDVPSPTSEFAHPEVSIGLTVLAYRHGGLRPSDVARVVERLQQHMSVQAGPFHDRPARILFQRWIVETSAAAGDQRKCSGSGEEWCGDVLPLELFSVQNQVQLRSLHARVRLFDQAIHYYLRHLIFPDCTRRQTQKLQASGMDIGSDMIFATRIGFSGTPSEIVPHHLRPCNFEAGSEARMISTLLSPHTVSVVHVERGWTVQSLLHSIATSRSPHFHALIDAGALVTGMHNDQVARALLDSGLSSLDACVFLNEEDEKMIMMRDGSVQRLAESGIPVRRRFSFYDQVHTTGMDITQPGDAVAAVLLGKDMTFRDYTQACWRMRGIGHGQRAYVFVVEEVNSLISNASKNTDERMRVVDWLLYNGIASEQVQWMQLTALEVEYMWRSRALTHLLQCSTPHRNKRDVDAPLLQTRFCRGITDRAELQSLLLRYEIPQRPTTPFSHFEDSSMDMDSSVVPLITLTSDADGGKICLLSTPPRASTEQFIGLSEAEKRALLQQRLAQAPVSARLMVSDILETDNIDLALRLLSALPNPRKRLRSTERRGSPANSIGDESAAAVQYLRVFQEDIDFDIPSDVPSQHSLSARLQESIEKHKWCLSSQDHDELRRLLHSVEEMAADGTKDDGDGDNPTDLGVGIERLDSEIVQEQEQELQQLVHSEAAPDPPKEIPKFSINRWQPRTAFSELASLLSKDQEESSISLSDPLEASYGSGHRIPFFRLSSLRFELHRKDCDGVLPYPPALLISPNHSSPKYEVEDPVLLSVHCFLLVCDTERQRSSVVILTIQEAESVRHALEYEASHRLSPPMYAFLISITGTVLASTAPSNSVPFSMVSRLALPDRAGMQVAPSMREAKLLLECARFFNGELSFDHAAVVLLLEQLQNTTTWQRQVTFEIYLKARRLPLLWKDTDVEAVFSHQNAAHLKELLSAQASIRLALASSFGSITEAFASIDRDDNGWVSVEEVLAALQSLSVENTPEVRGALMHIVSEDTSFIPMHEFVRAFEWEDGEDAHSLSPRTMRQASPPLSHQLSIEAGGVYSEVLEELRLRTSQRESIPMPPPMPGSISESSLAEYSIHTDIASSIGRLLLISGGSVLFGADHVATTRDALYPSVMPQGVLLVRGQWYFEVSIIKEGRLACGWADVHFIGNSRQGLGVGEDAHSYAVIVQAGVGVASHKSADAANDGGSWESITAGDVLCCAVDFHRRLIRFARNGNWDEKESFLIRHVQTSNAFIPCVSFQRGSKVSINLGSTPFRYPPPRGHRSVFRWICRRKEIMHAEQHAPHFGRIVSLMLGDSDVPVSDSNTTIEVKVGTFQTFSLGGVLLTDGRWYYEVTIVKEGANVQIGWASLQFSPVGQAVGVGDDPYSWSFDGGRQLLFAHKAMEWGERWKDGDVIGALVDVEGGCISYSLNGVSMGDAVTDASLSNGIFPAMSISRNAVLRVNFGEAHSRSELLYCPPTHRPVSNAIESLQSRLRASRGASDIAESQAAESLASEFLTRSQQLSPLAKLDQLGIYVTSGIKHCFYDAALSVFHATRYYPSAVADRCNLQSGKWYFEVRITLRPSSSGSDDDVHENKVAVERTSTHWRRKTRAVERINVLPDVSIGFADRRFFGDSFGGRGCGDDAYSWGIDQKGALRHNGVRELRSSPMYAGETIGCAVDVDGHAIRFIRSRSAFDIGAGDGHEEFGSVGFEHVDTVGGLAPAVSAARGIDIALNFGRHPFRMDISDQGFAPVHHWLLLQKKGGSE